jgi:hypothetical protein
VPEYRITMRKHQYSANVCAKSVFAIVPKLDYVMQYFMLFPMVCRILGHKLTKVNTARINKVIIAFFIELHCANIYIQQAFMQNLFAQLFPNSLYCAVFNFFPTIYSKLGHKLTNVKTARINKSNYFVCIY